VLNVLDEVSQALNGPEGLFVRVAQLEAAQAESVRVPVHIRTPGTVHHA
jgi:hypothetical protein